MGICYDGFRLAIKADSCILSTEASPIRFIIIMKRMRADYASHGSEQRF